MTAPDPTPARQDYTGAIGRTEERTALLAVDRVEALAHSLDLAAPPREGEALPGGWHWLFFNPFVKRSELGPDGHPRRGGFMPDVGLPRRMWAGGRLAYPAPLIVGAPATQISEIADVVSKSGRAGNLVFVTVRRRILQDGRTAIDEEQDIVYREAPAPDALRPAPVIAPEHAEWSEPFEPDPVLLFRYSALTSNGHRIHYDRPYAVGEEGYRDLVVHGPLIATLLHGFATRCRPGNSLSGFQFRAVTPLFVNRPFRLEAAPSGDGGLDVWARGPEGELAMKATVRFAA